MRENDGVVLRRGLRDGGSRKRRGARVRPADFPTLVVLCVLLVVTGGCASKKYYLSPTPNVVVESGKSPFEGLDDVRRTTDLKVIYVTDRKQETTEDGEFAGDYTSGRSRTTFFGEALVTVEDTTWEEFEEACSSPERDRDYILTPTKVIEKGAFPRQSRFGAVDPVKWDEKEARATSQLREIIHQRLAETPVKEVYVFVHGYSTKFGRIAMQSSTRPRQDDLCVCLGSQL